MCMRTARVAIVNVHVASESALQRTALLSCPFGLLAAPGPGHAASGQGRTLGAAPDARLHTPQL